MLNKTQVKIILILLDNKGHPEWELAEHLNIADSNLNPVLKKLEDMKSICIGSITLSHRQHARKGIYSAIPYFRARTSMISGS